MLTKSRLPSAVDCMAMDIADAVCSDVNDVRLVAIFELLSGHEAFGARLLWNLPDVCRCVSLEIRKATG